jgi:uncharacterized protein YuzE
MEEKLTIRRMKQIALLCPIVTQLPVGEFYVCYDEGADVLYVQFRQPADIYISDIRPDGIILEYDRRGELVGVTILNASKRVTLSQPKRTKGKTKRKEVIRQ